MTNISKLKLPGDNTEHDIISKQTRGIFRCETDNTSTSTSFIVIISGITELYDGLALLIKNTVVESASGCTLNVNNLGAKRIWLSLSAAYAATNWALNSTYLFVYDLANERWEMEQGYNTNTNTQVRVYRQSTYSNTYPLIASRTIDSNIGTPGSNGTYDAVYGLINDDTNKTPKINMGTGELIAKKFVGDISGGTDLTSSQVTTALGYTPYNSTNPDGYTSVTVPDDILAFDAGTRGTALVAGDNVDNLDIGKTYYSADSSVSSQLSGTPPTTTSGFKIVTYRNYSVNYIYQFATSARYLYYRTKIKIDSTTYEWADWQEFYTTDNLPITDGNPTLDWGTQSTVATIGTTDIHVTMPANPNIDESVKQKLISTNYNRPLLMSTAQTSSSTSEPVGLTYRNNSIYGNPSTGNVGATTFNGYTLSDACAKSVDTTVTGSSSNLITSGGVYDYSTALHSRFDDTTLQLHLVRSTVQDVIDYLGVPLLNAATRDQTDFMNVATFTTDLDYPLIKCKVKITAIQDGSGLPSLSNIRNIIGRTDAFVIVSRKNLFDKNGGLIGIFYPGANTILSSTNARTICFPCKPNTTYTISKTSGKRFRVCYSKEVPDVGVSIYSKVDDDTASSMTYTTGSDAKYLCVYFYSATYDTISEQTMTDSIQIEYGSTATTFQQFEGDYHTVSFGQTLYGAFIDLTTGILWITHTLYDLATYTGAVAQAGSGSKRDFSFTELPILPKISGEVICDRYESNTISTTNENIGVSISIQENKLLFRPENPSSYTSSTIMDYITNTLGSMMICYEMKDYIRVKLTPQQVLALTSELASGISATPCYVSADCGDVSTEYNETIRFWIEKEAE